MGKAAPAKRYAVAAMKPVKRAYARGVMRHAVTLRPCLKASNDKTYYHEIDSSLMRRVYVHAGSRAWRAVRFPA